MAIHILVDEIQPGGKLAVTTNFDKVNYNLQKTGGRYFNDFINRVNKSEDGDYFDGFVCGRYLCAIQQTVIKKETFMMFYDCENNRDVATNISSTFLKYPNGEENQGKFIMAFLRLEPIYKESYDTVELTLDASPLS
jgi:hypothetical protein